MPRECFFSRQFSILVERTSLVELWINLFFPILYGRQTDETKPVLKQRQETITPIAYIQLILQIVC